MKFPSPRDHILLITRNFPPLVGGMEKLNYNLAKEISRSSRVSILTIRGAEQFATTSQVVRTCPKSLPLFLLCASFKIVLDRAKTLFTRTKKPNLVLAGSGTGAPVAWLASQLIGCRWGIYLHGLDIIARHPVYRILFLPLIRKADFWIANSSATRQKAIDIGIPSSKIDVVHPGIEMPVASAGSEERVSKKLVEELGDGPLLLSVGRLTKRKGLVEFINQALPRIAEIHTDVKLVIAGAVPKQALLANNVTPADLMKAAKQAGVARNIILLGSVSEDDLAWLYRHAKIHVFPLIPVEGDMEGFGMVAVEAASYGLPTVAFAEGGVVDAVAEGTSGYLVESGNYGKLAHRVISILSGESRIDKLSSIEFAKRFQWSEFGKAVKQSLDKSEPH